jgi:Mn-dependent DtxR family transcriptional regulator
VIYSLYRQQRDTTQQLGEMAARLEAAERTITEMTKRIEELEKAQ